jgi:hypothetical protein
LKSATALILDRYRIWSIKFTVPKIGVSNSPSGRLTD